MIGLPWPPVRYSIRIEKITGYLLDPTHATGGPKARFFMAFGFDAARPAELMDALAGHFINRAPSRRLNVPDRAPRVVFEGPIVAPDGRSPRVRSVWWVDEEHVAHFVTAVPLTD